MTVTDFADSFAGRDGAIRPLNPSNSLAALEEAASKIGKRVFAAYAGNDTDLDAALGALSREQVGALLVAADAYFDTRRKRITTLAAPYRIPALFHFREYVVDGGLISYGPRSTDAYRQVGVYAGRLLRGTSPSDLPVVQANKFEFVLNLNTAKALELRQQSSGTTDMLSWAPHACP